MGKISAQINDEIQKAVLDFQKSGGKNPSAVDRVTNLLYGTLKDAAIRRFPWNHDEAAEVLHDYLMGESGLRKSIGSWRPGKSSIATYSINLLNQFCMNRRRSVKNRKESDMPDEAGHIFCAPGAGPETISMQKAGAILLREIFIDCIESIEPPQYKRFLQMHYFFDAHMSRKEIARLLEVPLGTLGSGIKRAMNELQSAIKIRIHHKDLDPADLLNIPAGRFDEVFDKALARLTPEKLRRFIEDVVGMRSCEAAAQKHGYTRTESLEMLMKAVEHFMKHASYRGRKRVDILAEMGRITAEQWDALVTKGYSGVPETDLLYRRILALVHGRPPLSLREMVLTEAGGKKGFSRLCRELNVKPTHFAAFMAGVKALPEESLTLLAKKLRMDEAQAAALDECDREITRSPSTRHSGSAGRKLLEFEWRNIAKK